MTDTEKILRALLIEVRINNALTKNLLEERYWDNEMAREIISLGFGAASKASRELIPDDTPDVAIVTERS